MSTPLLPLDVWQQGMMQPSVIVNEALLRIEALSVGALSIESVEPQEPDDGDCYIIGDSPTGSAWSAANDGDVALYRGGAWRIYAPVLGLLKLVGTGSAAALYAYTGTEWAEI